MTGPVGVTGATGGVGGGTIRHLLGGGEAPAPEVVALARRPQAIPAAPGLTARHADYDDPASLREAFAGLHTLVFVSSDGVVETMRRHHGHVVAAAVAADVQHVVYTSILDITPASGFYYSPAHQATEAALVDSGIAHTVARTSVFADFFASTWLAPALEAGVLALPLADAGMSLVTREDTAAVLAALARSRPGGHVDVTGPAALTGPQIAAASVDATGRRLAFEDLDPAGYRARMERAGDPGWLVQAFTTMFEAVRAGRFATVSTDVAELTGRPPQDYTGFLRDG